MRNHPTIGRGKRAAAVILAMVLVASVASPALAHEESEESEGFLTGEPLFITMASGLSDDAYAKALISSGDMIGDFMFEGLPDGIGVRPGAEGDTVDVYVAHENTTVPFFGTRDFEAASVSKLTLTTKEGNRGAILDASVALSADEGFERFCSASIAGPEEGLDDYIFFTGEEQNSGVGDDQRGYAVVLNTDTGESTAVPGMGRLNHENTVVIPGDWDSIAMLTTDDTFNRPTSQLYMYIAEDQDAIFDDTGSLWALRITTDNGTPVDPTDPFNGANDYIDLAVGDEFAGEFIPVPRDIAIGDQDGLEDWSNENNVFQAVRLEDLAADKDEDGVVYIADTGGTQINADPATGRMQRTSGVDGVTDNGRIFKLVLDEHDPTVVESLTVLADGDAVGTDAYVPFTSPDNVDTSEESLMVQEDTKGGAAIWQYRFDLDDDDDDDDDHEKGDDDDDDDEKGEDAWRVVANVNDLVGESSGIVDASEWFGDGAWILDVQGHGTNIDEEVINGVTHKRESGQLILMQIPES